MDGSVYGEWTRILIPPKRGWEQSNLQIFSEKIESDIHHNIAAN